MTMDGEKEGPVRFPPPLVYLGLLLAGFAAEGFAGLRTLGLARPAAWAIGALLLVAGGVFAGLALGLFRRADTPPEPWLATQRIVTTGIYARTRNPMYLGMALIYAGLAIALDGPVALLLLPVVILLIQTQVIAREERYLETAFGEEYRAYKTQVRRWL
jgi:protein-S-isoprenylcysteine O-methyltransferase Ste14